MLVRCKKLFSLVDLTKDFYFSPTYNVMFSLQDNMGKRYAQQDIYESRFVWNEFITREIRNQLEKPIWTIHLVHGYFEQKKLTVEGKEFNVTLIARRSHHNAGTRYMARGVNEAGDVANEIETEQLVFECTQNVPPQISSVVQHRGSIPLIWSQKSTPFKPKPAILLHEDLDFKASYLHFDNLSKRYGDPIIILNLIKSQEKKPYESLLGKPFGEAIEHINESLPEERHLKFMHLDVNQIFHPHRALACVGKKSLELTGLCCYQREPAFTFVGSSSKEYTSGDLCEDADIRTLMRLNSLQKGVLRTNCIDCSDRTNGAQFAYGLAALEDQLHKLGILHEPKIDIDSPLYNGLMECYRNMGDVLSMQYCGSAAQNKCFSSRKGDWVGSRLPQKWIRVCQRQFSNVFMDSEKQKAINLFLGSLPQEHGPIKLPEHDSDLQSIYNKIETTSFVKESLQSLNRNAISDFSVLCKSDILEDIIDQYSGNIRAADELGAFSPTSVHSEFALHIDAPSISSPSSEAAPLGHSCTYRRVNNFGSNILYSNFMDIELPSTYGLLYDKEANKSFGIVSSAGDGTATPSRETWLPDEGARSSFHSCASTEYYPSVDLSEYGEYFSKWVEEGEIMDYDFR